MSIVLQSTGGGQITLQEPTTASNFTQTLPAATGVTMVSGNQPAFSALVTGTTTITAGVFTKMVFNSENWDTANCFDSTTNFRFTPNVAGYYLITGSLDAGTSTNATRVESIIFRNGSIFRAGVNLGTSAGNSFNGNVSSQVFLNGTTDFVELFAFVLASTAQYTASTGTWFDGILVRTA